MERLNEFLNSNKLSIALSLVGLVLITGGILSSNLTQPKKQFSKESVVSKESLSIIKVDVSGAVAKPAVYSLPINSRVEDAVNIAGGFASNANQQFISKSLNLSQKVSDGQKIYIPLEGDLVTLGVVAGAQTSTKIGINSVSQSKLEELPGVGPATASKIISGRPYNDLNELLSKKAVSRSVFEKIKDLVDLN